MNIQSQLAGSNIAPKIISSQVKVNNDKQASKQHKVKSWESLTISEDIMTRTQLYDEVSEQQNALKIKLVQPNKANGCAYKINIAAA